jgi:uncharacterized membrane-anchored protein YhcB (DUF1043 family)
MKRALPVIEWLVGISIIALLMAVIPSSASAIKKHTSCDDELEETRTQLELTRTQLRLRTAELLVAHGQLNSALKKLKKCGVAEEE